MSLQSTTPSGALVSCAVTRSEATLRVRATSRVSADLPRKRNDELRPATRKPGTLLRPVISSSAIPSPKYAFTVSPASLSNGSTATEWLSAVVARGRLMTTKARAATSNAAAATPSGTFRRLAKDCIITVTGVVPDSSAS